MVDTSHDQEATPTTQSRDQIGVTPPDHVGMSEAQQRIVDSLQDAGNVRTHCTTCAPLLFSVSLFKFLLPTLPSLLLPLAQVVMFAVEPMPWCEHLVQVQPSPPHTLTYPHPITPPSSFNLHYSFSPLLPSLCFLCLTPPPPPR